MWDKIVINSCYGLPNPSSFQLSNTINATDNHKVLQSDSQGNAMWIEHKGVKTKLQGKSMASELWSYRPDVGWFDCEGDFRGLHGHDPKGGYQQVFSELDPYGEERWDNE